MVFLSRCIIFQLTFLIIIYKNEVFKKTLTVKTRYELTDNIINIPYIRLFCSCSISTLLAENLIQSSALVIELYISLSAFKQTGK